MLITADMVEGADIPVPTKGTITEVMLQEVPYSERFWVALSLAAFTARSGGLITPYRYLQRIMIHIIHIPIRHLLM